MPRKKLKPVKSRVAEDVPPTAAPQRAETFTTFHHRDHARLGTDEASNSLRFLLRESFDEAIATGRQIALADEFNLDVWLSLTDDVTDEPLDHMSFRKAFKTRRSGKSSKPSQSVAIYVHAKARDEAPAVEDTRSLYMRNLAAWGQLPTPRPSVGARSESAAPAPAAPVQQPSAAPPSPAPTPPPASIPPAPKRPRVSAPAEADATAKRQRLDSASLSVPPRRESMPAPSPPIRAPSKSQTPAPPVAGPSRAASASRTTAVIDLDDSDDEVVLQPKSARPTPVPMVSDRRSESDLRRSISARPPATTVTLDDSDDSDIEVVQQIVRGGTGGVTSSPARTPTVADAASWGVKARAVSGASSASLDVHDWYADSKRASGMLGDLLVFPLSEDGVVKVGSSTPGQVVVILDQLVVHAIRSRSRSKPTFELAIAGALQPPNFSRCSYLGTYEVAFDRTLTGAEYEALPRPQRRDLIRGLTSNEQWDHFSHLPSVARVPTTAAARGKAGMRWLRTQWGAYPPMEPNGYIHDVGRVAFSDLRFRHATQEGAEQALKDGYVDGLGFIVARCVGYDRAMLDAALDLDRRCLAAVLGESVSPQRQKLRPGQLSSRLQSSLQQRPK